MKVRTCIEIHVLCTFKRAFVQKYLFSIHDLPLDALVADGFVQKQKLGRGNYYVNLALSAILDGGLILTVMLQDIYGLHNVFSR